MKKATYLALLILIASWALSYLPKPRMAPEWATRKASKNEIASRNKSSSSLDEKFVKVEVQRELVDYGAKNFLITTKYPRDLVIIKTSNESRSDAGIGIYFIKNHDITVSYDGITFNTLHVPENKTFPVLFTKGGKLVSFNGEEASGMNILVTIH